MQMLKENQSMKTAEKFCLFSDSDRRRENMSILKQGYLAIFSVLSLLLLAACSAPESNTAKEITLSAEELTELADQAYTYGLGPMVYYRLYSEQLTREDSTFKVNDWLHRRNLADHANRGGQAPNHDTIYSLSWLDVSNEPLVIQIPDYEGSFYGVQLTTMYQENFQNIGNSMAYGNKDVYQQEYTFVLATPDWDGETPEGIDVIRTPSPIVHFLQRSYVTPNDPEDLARINRLQDKHRIVPLSAWNAGSRKEVEIQPILPNLEEETELDFLAGLNQLLNAYPPTDAAEKDYIQRFKAINVGNGNAFDAAGLSPEIRDALLAGIKSGKQKVADLQKGGIGYVLNGWAFTDERQGNYKGDYLLRGASVAMGGIIPRPQFNTYSVTFHDGKGELLDGNNNYKIHFEKDQIPQATAFWSMTVYGMDWWLPDLSDKRYKLSNLSPGIVYNEDGSLDMYFQHEAPAEEKFANWLPIPKDKFFAVIRFYAPVSAPGEYAPPFIQPIED
jgi:hypothetical protein